MNRNLFAFRKSLASRVIFSTVLLSLGVVWLTGSALYSQLSDGVKQVNLETSLAEARSTFFNAQYEFLLVEGAKTSIITETVQEIIISSTEVSLNQDRKSIFLSRFGPIPDPLGDEIASVENTPGNQVESAAESSWDAWIKYYRPNENSRNASVSYYDKGALLGGVLNMWIIQQTKGEKCLDDVFKFLYQTYYLKAGRGFTDQELEDAFSKVAGASASDFFKTHIYGVKTPAYVSLFKAFGYQFTDANSAKTVPYIGLTISAGRVSSIYKGGAAYVAGLNVGDEILKVNGADFPGIDKLVVDKKPGDSLVFSIKRDGMERTFLVAIQQTPLKAFVIESEATPTEAQLKLRHKWLGGH